MVGIACVFDFLDGFMARILKVNSEIGKQLDSLADMVSFGLVPGVVMYQLITYSLFPNPYTLPDQFGSLWIKGNLITPTWDNWHRWTVFLPLIGFLVTIFSAIRLAKFNIDTRQTDSFIGVPTPANSILICSLPLILDYYRPIHEGWTVYPPTYSPGDENVEIISSLPLSATLSSWILNPWFLISLAVITSFLLVSGLPLFALKFKNFSWGDNKIRYIFLLLSLTMLILFRYVGIPFIIVLYIVISVINNIINRKTSSNYE